MRGPAILFLSIFCALSVMACARDAQSSAAIAAKHAADSTRADSSARAKQDSFNRAQPGYVIDSILPPEEEMRRFRAAVPGVAPKAFEGGSGTRNGLVERFIASLAANDVDALRNLVIHAREFSDLYYPASPYSHPPYRQPVSFAWRLIQDPSSTGLSKLLKKVGGKPLKYVSDKCDPVVVHEGPVTRYTGCLVRLIDERGDTVTRRYFGSIVELGGQFKFLSYTNDI